VTVYPEKELLLFQKERKKFSDIIMENAESGREFPDEMISRLNGSEGPGNSSTLISGIEDLFPLVMKPDTILSYLGENSRIIMLNTEELLTRRNLVEKTFSEYYTKRRKKTLCLPPHELIDSKEYERAEKSALKLNTFTSSPDSLRWKIRSVPSFGGRINNVREEISRRADQGWSVIVTTGFEGQARRLYDLLESFAPSSDFESLDPESALNILITPLKESMEIEATRTIIITDHEIFGKSYRKKRKFKKGRSQAIESFLDLEVGDFVVHINHGIGIFRGIERMTAGGVERDFLNIEYADGDRLYISLDKITLVQKYIGIEGRKPKIDHLGKKSAWNRIKSRVEESVEEIARDLLKIYSKRNTMKGFRHPPDTEWQEEFEARFEYEETPDQITAIEDVKDDMESDKPMDRLICGDVGFGKTEVAIRASFKSVMAGMQVAVLVPTTVLAMQHYNTFRNRFSGYPIEIEMISRFRTRTEINRIKEKLKNGGIDIIIGTHALIMGKAMFKNLGLLVIDEEQKFGVKHKEKLKEYRSLVDVMTLSATPIPRTLHMSMSGIRDLSTITTPPENRQSINTYVLEENPDILRDAIMNEINRDGQVFFVHNRVETIEAVTTMLRKLIPEASFCVGHGQMHEHELEDVMMDFLDRKYDVLVATTIIESGLDIPNVNTIIINRAEILGLSQLYQLKGRVGRSARKAYAFLFYPKHIPLTEEAQKRLQVISEYSELGSGFKVAMKDMEIRGAGNILGREQSGSIMEVGFELYCQMLDDAVKRLSGEKKSEFYRTPVFLNTDFYIPDSYIADEKQKIEFYKRFESCQRLEEIDDLKSELIDRFGMPPPKVEVLIQLEEIRTIASIMRISEIIEDSSCIKLKITGDSLIEPERIVMAIGSDKRITLDPDDSEKLCFVPKSNAVEKKMLELKKWLQQIS
jgi:transcription-repair coupling factor (superfamily II helicase)